jgi:hypothetical protein
MANTNVFAPATDKFVVIENLSKFWEKSKDYIDTADASIKDDVKSISDAIGDSNTGILKDLADLRADINGLSGGDSGVGSISTQINNALATLDADDAAVDGKYISSVTQVDGKITVIREDLPDFSEAISDAEQAAKDYADEKVDDVSTAVDGLSTRISGLENLNRAVDASYDGQFIYLIDKDGNKLGAGFDASEFIVDGFLDAVAFEEVEGVKTNNLVFTFNTASGKTSFTVDFSKYVDAYHADNVSLELNSETNTFSIKNVDATKTTLGADIQIAGGPLANDIAESGEVWPEGWTKDGVKIIPQGKSLEEILTALFLKVVNGTVSWGTASWSPTINDPSATLSSSELEVGSSIKVTKLAAGAVDAKSRTATCICSEGYFNADASGNPTGSCVSGNKTISIDGSIEGTAALTCKWNGNVETITVNSTELEVVEGTNTLNVAQSGQTAKCDALPTTKVFAATNTKTLLQNVHATFTDTDPEDKALTKSKDFTMTGKYKYFMGYSSNTLFSQFNSAGVRALTTKTGWITKDGTTTIVDGNAIKSNGKSIVIACPAKYKLATINNGVGANIIDNFTTKGSYGSVDVTTGNITTVYTVYVYPITNGAEVEFKNVTLTKA